MPIVHSDRISGSIYVIATSAEAAQRMAFDYLRDTSKDYHVFDREEDASDRLRDAFRAHDERERVYAVSLDIRVTDEK
ncbi:hypothetical protein ACIHCX_03635 [Streptomyces sp. NPDC052043]|uniref:hypothetical protein n=1 Tax=Streptomyces sp. NPDC052043 TaxID=3365684 RepID=UPI0037D9858C